MALGTDRGSGRVSADWARGLALLLLGAMSWPVRAWADPWLITPVPPPHAVLESVRDTISFETRQVVPLDVLYESLLFRSKALGKRSPVLVRDPVEPLRIHALSPSGAWGAADRMDVRLVGAPLGFDHSLMWTLGVGAASPVQSYSQEDQSLETTEAVREVRFGDFDGDDIADVAALTTRAIKIFYGAPCAQGQILFDQENPYVYNIESLGRRAFLDVGDLDNSGFDDVVLVTETQPEYVHILLANSDARSFREYSDSIPRSEQDPVAVELVYLDNDDLIDVVLLADTNNTLRALVTRMIAGRPRLIPFGTSPAIRLPGDPLALVSGDFSAPPDGHADVVVSLVDRRLIFLENRQGEALVEDRLVRTEVSGPLGGMAAVDLNQDGFLDLVGFDLEEAGTIRRVTRQGNAEPFLETSESVSIHPAAVRIADVSADGREDVLLSDGDAVVALVAEGGERALASGLGGLVSGFDLSDLNCDGAPDLLAVTGTRVQVRLNRPEVPGGIRGGERFPDQLFDDAVVCLNDAVSETLCVISAYCPIEIQSMVLDSTALNSGAYALDVFRGTVPDTLMPGDSLCVAVSFSPSWPGPAAIAPFVSLRMDCEEQEIPLGGIGSSGALDFTTLPSISAQCLGSRRVERFVVRNDDVCLEGVVGSRLVSAGGVECGFSVVGTNAPVTLAPGDSAWFDIEFAPTENREYCCDLEVNLDGGRGTLTAEICALGVIGDVIADDPELEFGEVCEPDTSVLALCLRNLSASCSRTVVGLYLDSGDPELCPFTILSSPGNFELAPEEELCVDVSFDPRTRGEFGCEVRVALAGPEDTLSVPLVGSCNNPPFWVDGPEDQSICEAGAFFQENLDYHDPDHNDGIECLEPEFLEGSDEGIRLVWDCDARTLDATTPGPDYIGWALYRLTIADGIGSAYRDVRYEVRDVNDPPVFEISEGAGHCSEEPPVHREGSAIVFRVEALDGLDRLDAPGETCESPVSWIGDVGMDPAIPLDAIRRGRNPDGSVFLEFEWLPGFGDAGSYRFDLRACEDEVCGVNECNPAPVALCDSTTVCFVVENVLPDLSVEISGVPAELPVRAEVPFSVSVQVEQAPWEEAGAVLEVRYDGAPVGSYPIPEFVDLGDAVIFEGSFMSGDPRPAELSACLVLVDSGVEDNLDNNCDAMSLRMPEGTLSVRPNPFTPNGDGFNDDAEFRVGRIRVGKPVVSIYDMHGRLVRRLNSVSEEALRWNGRDASGRRSAPGVYLYVYEDPANHRYSGEITLAR